MKRFIIGLCILLGIVVVGYILLRTVFSDVLEWFFRSLTGNL